MDKIERKLRSLTGLLLTAVLVAFPVHLAAQDAPEQEAQQQEQKQEARAPRGLPQVTGTVLAWNGYRIDLKTAEGKTQQVAVNKGTERLVEIEPGAEITVEYRRKIGDFVIAEKVRPVQKVESGEDAAAEPSTVTGTVVSWTNAALVLRTEEGDVTLFLSPRTESPDKPFDAGLPVTVEYQETASGAKLATRIQAAVEENRETGE